MSRVVIRGDVRRNFSCCENTKHQKVMFLSAHLLIRVEGDGVHIDWQLLWSWGGGAERLNKLKKRVKCANAENHHI